MNDQGQRRLLLLSAVFILLLGIVLSLSPAVRERTWATPLLYSHWAGIGLWAGVFLYLQRQVEKHLRGHDPYILPLCALLSGWGLLTIWRLDPSFGWRQVVWLLVSGAACTGLVANWGDLGLLRRYKYVLLAMGLTLTALTIVLGTSPGGAGPRLWLGCCGIYLQPSEPLKLLLVIYLAAYLADYTQLRSRTFPLLAPTLLVFSLALVLLLVQRDLGSASIFILLFALVLFLATEQRRVLVLAAVALVVAGIAGFFFVPIIQARLDSWISPWTDPSGRSYQIVQSLMSVANGGLLGRGIGIGSPGLVPVAHSDFIYTAIAEEMGLAGSIGLLTVYGLLFSRGLIIAIHSSERFHRLLAAGLTAYLGIQALLIIAGDLRLLPLTGVTLPFIAYGGSSLLTSAIAVAILLTISARAAGKPTTASHFPMRALAGILATGLLGSALAHAWWSVVQSHDLLARTDNARRSIADRYVVRGSLLDRRDQPVNFTAGESGSLRRMYAATDLSPVVGYTHPIFGQAGLEASLDGYLRGEQGNPLSLLAWDELVYGTPPPGLDVRLTIDLHIQRQADVILADRAGAAVMLNAQTGEILAMASHPTYDASQLDSGGIDLLQHQGTPLVNRAAQGAYNLHDAVLPLLFAARIDTDRMPAEDLYRLAGFYRQPQMRMPVGASIQEGTGVPRVSPLQVALAAAALSNGGMRPAPRIALAVKTPLQGWVVLQPLENEQRILSAAAARLAADHYSTGGSFWQWRTSAATGGETLTWYLAGTLPEAQGPPLTVVVLLENGDAAAATRIGLSLLQATGRP